MEFGIFDLLRLIGAIGFFIYGMKVMSEGIQKAAGNRLRQILRAMTKNRYFGVLTGFLITALVQSSSATTVMTVSFVNAGLLSLVESAGVMMGANIGTTITAWLVSILGFKVKIAAFALPLIAFGFPMMLSRKGARRSWGEFLIGFALLFLGLNELKEAVPDLKGNPEVLAFLAKYADHGILSSLMFVAVGTLVTIIVQSSSAAMALTITMCYEGWIPFEVAAPMVLGENIGTTITAELASVVANVHAKRSARIHSMFNIIGVTWMVLIYPVFLGLISKIMVYQGSGDPFVDSHAIPIGLSYFHTMFNLSNVLLLIWFVPLLVKVAVRTVPSRGDLDEEFRLEYINTGLMGTPEISVFEAKKEVGKFGEVVLKMSNSVRKLMEESDPKKQAKLLKKIRRYEENTDRLEVEISNYLTKASEGELSEELSLRIRGMLSMINDLERIGDIYYQMSKSIEKKIENKRWFTPEQRQNIIELFDMVDGAIAMMNKNLSVEKELVDLGASVSIEQSINKKRNTLRKAHLRSIEQGDYNVLSGLVYQDLFGSLEKVGDHVINVSEAAAGEI